MDKGKITAAFATLLLITTIIASFLPQATATPTAITAITPNSGPVGTTVRVTGEIDTVNGSYQIRWDGESVKNGTAVEKAVNDTFAVPLSGEGDHNVTLYDVTNATESSPELFTVTTSYSVSAEPARRVEGFTTTITVGVYEAEANTTYTLTINVTDPQPIPAVYTATLTISTNATGSGSSSTLYYGNFTAGANTNYVGTYTIAVMTVDETLATGNFTVGLTDELEYRITNEVIIRGSGYEKGKFVTANITCVDTGETVFSENHNATDGTVSYKWTIPENATLGIYTVTLSNTTTPGTVKPIPDIQNFTVIEIIVYCQARNKYDKKPLADLSIGVFLKETNVTSGKTNKTGWVDFRLDRGNYTFKVFWKDAQGKDVQVGILEDQSITGNLTEYVLQKTFNVECELAHITIVINDEAGHPLPFINVTLTYIHPTSLETETIQFETNYTGIIATNTFTNTNYTIEARRYDHLFNTTLVENLTFTRDGKDRINITCPTYTLFVHTMDSKRLPLKDVQVEVYEWSSLVLADWGVTDDQGNVNLSVTFGRYKVKVYGTVLEREVLLNETLIDLFENRSLPIHCKTFNVDLYVEALDYFGQPIPKALVEVERKFGLEWVKIDSLPTGSDGFARFVPLRGLVGGDCRVSVYVAGKLCGIRNLYLDGSKQILFKIGKYTVIVGHPVETSQLIVYISIGLLVVVFGLALTYRRLLRRFVKKKEKS